MPSKESFTFSQGWSNYCIKCNFRIMKEFSIFKASEYVENRTLDRCQRHETPCVKMLKQFLRALYLILYSEALCSSQELCQEKLFYLAKGSLTSTFQVCSTYSEIHIKEIIMPNASISRAHVLLQMKEEERSRKSF